MLHSKIHGGKILCSQSDLVSSTLGAGRQLSRCSGRGCPTGPCFRKRPRGVPAGVACDRVPALVLVDVDTLHIPLCEDIAGAAGQAWGERREMARSESLSSDSFFSPVGVHACWACVSHLSLRTISLLSRCGLPTIVGELPRLGGPGAGWWAPSLRLRTSQG